MANRHLRPTLAPILLTLLLAPWLTPATAQRVQGKPSSAEGSAQELFDRYTALHGACDPAVLDLFVEDAGITIAQVHIVSGRSRLLELPVSQYRRILPQELKRYHTAGQCLVFTPPKFEVQDDGSVWIETSRTLHQGRFIVPLRLRVARQDSRGWRILEQRAGEPRPSRTVAEKIELWREAGTEQAVEALENFWRGSDPANQARAAEALVEIAERFQRQGAVRQAGRLGLDLYLSSAAPEVRRRAFAVYVRSVTDAAVPRLQSILRGRQDADFRDLALELLAELSGPRAQALQREVGLETESFSALDGQIVEWIPYELPRYAELREEQRRDLEIESDAQEYEKARRDSRFVLRKARYRSDNLLVVAYVYGPVKEPEKPLPVILFTRGSYVMGDVAPLLLPTFHRLASAGFLVVAPQYRGSDGGQGRDEMGGADVDDVLNAARLAVELPGADPRNLFVYGISRGGMMALQAIREGLKARAVVTLGAFTDLEATIGDDPGMQNLARQIWPDFERNREGIVHRRSALRWAEALKVPLLLLHGGEDEQISPSQTLRLGLRLEELGYRYQLYILAGDDHTLSGRPGTRDRLVTRWFRIHRGRR